MSYHFGKFFVLLFMMEEIKTEEEYEKVLNRIYELMQKDLKKDSDEMNELEVLSAEAEKYEAKKFSM